MRGLQFCWLKMAQKFKGGNFYVELNELCHEF